MIGLYIVQETNASSFLPSWQVKETALVPTRLLWGYQKFNKKSVTE